MFDAGSFVVAHCYCCVMEGTVLLLCYGGYSAIAMLWKVQCYCYVTEGSMLLLCYGGYIVFVTEGTLCYGGYRAIVMLRRV